MVKARKYIVVNVFQGLPKREDFAIVEEELPPLKSGEILVKTEWLSVDPHQRLNFLKFPVPYDQLGYQVGTVIETKNSDYPVGTNVLSYKGWRDYTIINPSSAGKEVTNHFYKLPDLKGLSPSHGVGAVGMPGASAYLGFLKICEPKPGETVVITGAAGAVGALVGQIAKIKGCKVIGFAGSDKKVKWLESIGFDKAFNYKTVDTAKALSEAAPEGVDCFFDNVGGENSVVIISKMNVRGRVTICGNISAYNEDPGKVTSVQPYILEKQLKVIGFGIFCWLKEWPEAFVELIVWIKSGKIKAEEHITVGFENMYDAFVGMMTGENTGKAVVKV